MQQVPSRETKAAYALRGVADEMARTFPLAPSETVLEAGIVRSGRRAAFLRLTDKRLCLIEHFALRADRRYEMPPTSVISSTREPQSLLVTWRTADGQDRSTKLSVFDPRGVGGPAGAAVTALARRYSQPDLDRVHRHLMGWTL